MRDRRSLHSNDAEQQAPRALAVAESFVGRRLRTQTLAALLFAVALTSCGSDSAATDSVLREGNGARIRLAYREAGGVEVAVNGTSPAAAASAGATNAVGGGMGSAVNGVSTAATVSSATAQPTASDLAADDRTASIQEDATPASSVPAQTSEDGADLVTAQQFEMDALAAINAARAQPRQCGDRAMPAVGPLRWNPRAAYAALIEAEWMQRANTFGHEWPTGEHVWHRLVMAGYDWTKADENIAAGFRTLEATMQGWIDSPPHCRALMRADIAEVGVAVVPGNSGNTYPSYWAMVLATPRVLR